ncbi:hypothetical protein Tco_0625988, partial [Tanacetum coccineum]
NSRVICEEEAKRRNSGTKTKTFEENCYLLLYVEPIPRDLPPTQFLGHLKEQIGSLYRTREAIRMIGNPEKIHNAKAQEDEGDMDVG